MKNLRTGPLLLAAAFGAAALAAAIYAASDFSGARTFLTRSARALVLLLPQFLGMLAIGWQVLTRLDFSGPRTAIGSVFAAALGLGIVSHSWLLLGLLGLLYPGTAWAVFAVLGGLGLLEIWSRRADYRALAGNAAHRLTRISPFAAIALILLAVTLAYPILADAMVPPLENDEIAYHLPIAQIYIDANRIVEIPFIPYSNWPVGLEMLYTFELLFATDTVAHLLTYGTFLLLLGGVFFFVRRHSGRTGAPADSRAALLAALLLASVYGFQVLAGTGMTEAPLAMFTFFAMSGFLEWVRSDDRRYFILSAVFAGFAASLKLNAAVYAAILGAFVLLRFLFRKQFRTGLLHFAGYGLVAGVVVLPWYLKSWIIIGNPVWAFLPGIFGARYWDEIGQEYLIGFIRMSNQPFSLVNWAAGFFDLTFNPGRYGNSYRMGQNVLVFFSFILAGLFLLKNRPRTIFLTGLALFIAFYTNWFLTTQQTRFFLPALPILTALIGMGIDSVLRLKKRPLNFVLLAAALFYFAAVSWPVDVPQRNIVRNNWPYLTGKVSQAEYLRANMNIHRAVEYLNLETAPDAYVLMGLYEPRSYYMEREYFWLNPLAQRVIRMEEMDSPEALLADLQQRGFTHILFNPAWLPQLDTIAYSTYYTPLFLETLSDLEMLFTANGIEVYAVPPAR